MWHPLKSSHWIEHFRSLISSYKKHTCKRKYVILIYNTTTCSVVITFSPHLEKHKNTCVFHLDYKPMFCCLLFDWTVYWIVDGGSAPIYPDRAGLCFVPPQSLVANCCKCSISSQTVVCLCVWGLSLILLHI